jgi:membrane-associated phospholipid phosphatase
MTAMRKWLLALLVTSAAVPACYFWFDRPVASWAHVEFPRQAAFVALTYIPDPLLVIAVVIFVLLGLKSFLGKPLSSWQMLILLCSVSVTMTEATKNELKFVFGRYWPDTWIHNNPSFIHDGAYGFHFFHGGAAYGSFPSGHTAIACAVASVLWIGCPKLRVLWALAVLAVVVGLIGADYHFVGDIIAGAFVGSTIGWMTMTLASGVRHPPADSGEKS